MLLVLFHGTGILSENRKRNNFAIEEENNIEDAIVSASFADEIIVVPLPTIARHIRERGFDHMELICQKLARNRGWRYQKVLDRVNNTVQVGASKEERQRQAMLAYKVNQIIESSATYLLVDDVWTTGSSMIAAEKILKTAGAQRIVAAVLTVSG